MHGYIYFYFTITLNRTIMSTDFTDFLAWMLLVDDDDADNSDDEGYEERDEDE